MTPLERLLLLFTAGLAAYQIAMAIEGLDALPVAAYTLAFGLLLVAALLLVILGFEVLENPAVVIVSTIIPLSLSVGLVWQHLPVWRALYLVLAAIGFLAILLSRLLRPGTRLSVVVLASVRGIAGLTIFLLPILWAWTARAPAGFSLVGVGGALIGVGGLLLAFLRAGRSVLPLQTILRLLPALLFLMTAAFVAGFALAGI